VQNAEVSSALHWIVVPNIPKIPDPMIPPFPIDAAAAGAAGTDLPPFAIIYKENKKI
jgi:hypothetical protein